MSKPQTPPFGLRLPPDLKMWVKMKARSEDRSMNNLLTQIVRNAMRQDEISAGSATTLHPR